MRVSKGGLGTHTNSIDPSVESVLNCALGADRIDQHVKLRDTRNDQILVSAVWYRRAGALRDRERERERERE